MPATNAIAGLEAAGNIQGKYVASVANISGVITVTYGGDAHATIQADSVLLTADTSAAGSVQWVCTSATIADKHLPAACR